MVIRQGDVFWATLGQPAGSEPGGRRPVVVVQSGSFNRSAIQTAVVASVTSNLRLGRAPGNVPLHRGEAALPRACVVNVSQLRTIDRDELRERIGTLSPERRREVQKGLALLLEIESGL